MRKRGRKNQSSRFQLFPVLYAHVYGEQARLLRGRGTGCRHYLIAGLLGTKAVMSNSVEFGSASNPTAAVQGAKLKMLMVFNDKPPGILAAQPGIKSVNELRGKKVGGSTVGSLDYGWLKELFPKFGLQLERDVIFLPIGSTSTRYSALRMGTIDASPLSPPSSFMAHDVGYPALLRFSH